MRRAPAGGQSTPPEAFLDDLPSEIVVDIIAHLDCLPSRAALARANRRMAHLCSAPAVWRSLDLPAANLLSATRSPTGSARLAGVHRLHVHSPRTTLRDDGVLELLTLTAAVTDLDLSGATRLSAASVATAVRCCEGLRSLRLRRCTAIAKQPDELASAPARPTLTSVDLSHTGADDALVLHMLRIAPRLQTLELSFCPSVSDAAFVSPPRTLRALKLLDCPHVSHAALTRLARSVPSLLSDETFVLDLPDADPGAPRAASGPSGGSMSTPRAPRSARDALMNLLTAYYTEYTAS